MKRYRNRTVERTLAVIETLAASKAALPLHQVAARSQLDPSTAFRLLHILCNHQYAHKDARTKLYSVGPKMFVVGSRPLAVATIVRQSQRFLSQLAALTGAAVHMGILEGTQVRYLKSVDASAGSAAVIRPGTRIDAHACAIGKVLLSCLPPDDFDARYRDITLRPRTRRTIKTVSSLAREIGSVRRSGFAVDRDECDLGLTRVAVPLIAPLPGSRVNHAIELGGPSSRLTSRLLPQLVSYAQKTASEIQDYIANSDRDDSRPVARRK